MTCRVYMHGMRMCRKGGAIELTYNSTPNYLTAHLFLTSTRNVLSCEILSVPRSGSSRLFLLPVLCLPQNIGMYVVESDEPLMTCVTFAHGNRHCSVPPPGVRRKNALVISSSRPSSAKKSRQASMKRRHFSIEAGDWLGSVAASDLCVYEFLMSVALWLAMVRQSYVAIRACLNSMKS